MAHRDFIGLAAAAQRLVVDDVFALRGSATLASALLERVRQMRAVVHETQCRAPRQSDGGEEDSHQSCDSITIGDFHASSRMNMKKSGAGQGQPASELISQRIAELGDWRGETLG